MEELLCDGCDDVFRKKATFDSHRLTCTKWKRTNESSSIGFYAAWQGTKNSTKTNGSTVRAEEKTLPLSQPLVSISTKVCAHCKKELRSSRGLKMHLKWCKLNKSKEETQGTQRNDSGQMPIPEQIQSTNLAEAATALPITNNKNLLGWGTHTDTELAFIVKVAQDETDPFKKKLQKTRNFHYLILKSTVK